MTFAVLLVTSAAFACPERGPARQQGTATPDAAVHSATDAALIGTGCSFSTGLMARRVMEEGTAWTAVDRLERLHEPVESPIAAPYVLAADRSLRVLATELLQALVDGSPPTAPFALTGRWLDVDGVRYVVLTSFEVVVL